MMKLYSYWRSSAAYRVRIVLNLKGLIYDTVPINLVEGEQNEGVHSLRNEMQSVPVLELDDGRLVSQSLAIIDYLETMKNTPPMLPHVPYDRAKVIEASHIVTSDIHPVNNLRVVKKLGDDFKADAKAKQQWMVDFMMVGLQGFQAVIQPSGKFSFGDQMTLADVVLIPQLYNARRWGVDFSSFSRLADIEKNCLTLEAFDKAHPENQIDAQQRRKGK